MTIDLNSKRKKYHIITFCLQLLVAFNTLVLYNMVKSGELALPMGLMVVFHLLILLGLHIVVLITCTLYFKSRVSKIIYGVFTFGGFIMNIISTAPNLETSETANFFRLLSTLIMMGVMITWFWMIVRDIFMEQHDLTYRILGAANIYWLSVVIFAYVYVVLETLLPGSIGLTGVSNADMVGNMYKLSLHATVSIDHPFTNIKLPLENLTLMQSAISHLFIVFLVGRLLTK